jgi:hypothetical protein
MYAFLIGKQGQAPTELDTLRFDGLIGASFSISARQKCFRSEWFRKP